MLEELKKKSIKKSLPVTIILLLCGIVIIALHASDLLSLFKGHVKFEDLDPEEINASLIVDATIKENFGAYMERYEKNTKTNITRTTDLYYVIWTGDEYAIDYRYMGIKVPASYKSKMEAMAEATYNYESSNPIEFSGAVNKMSSKEYEYFKEYFIESGFTEEEFEEYTLPYYISVGDLTGGAAASVYVVAGLGLILIIIGIFYLTYALSGGSLNRMKKEILDSGYSEDQVALDYAGAVEFNKSNNLKIGRLFTYFTHGSSPHAVMNDKIVWAYQKTTTHRTNGIKTGTTYEVIIYLYDKKVFNIAVSNEQTALQVLQYMNQTMPRVVLGYSDDLKKKYKKDYQGFLQIRYNNVEQNQLV